MKSPKDLAASRRREPAGTHPEAVASGSPAPAPQRKLRVALYSHDTMGIGHVRRNLLLARVLSLAPLEATCLLIAGTRQASVFSMPRGIDCLTLPALRKEQDGRYRPRSLDIPLEELTRLRSLTVAAALDVFAPDVLVVDKVPRGAGHELDRTLRQLREQKRTRCVLGLRDVLDDRATVQREWRRDQNEQVIREYYDAVWVYGDRAIYDPIEQYRFSHHTADKVRYTGYLDQRDGRRFLIEPASQKPVPWGEVDPLAGLHLPPGRLALCMVGGGEDGAPLAEAFVRADLPTDTNGLLVTGPFMPAEVRYRLRQRAAQHPRMRVLEFVAEPELLLGQADRFIGMGGYNTVCEVLSFEKPALIVPRIRPRREQWIRAERLRDLELLDVLHPDEASPAALSAWLASDPRPLPPIRERLDLGGLNRLPGLLSEVVTARPGTRFPAGVRPIKDLEIAAS